MNKNKNLIRIFSAMLSLLMFVVCIGTDFSPAKYKNTFPVGNVGLTVEAEELPEEPVVTTVLEKGYTFSTRIKNATTITFGKPKDYPQFEWSLTDPVGVKVDADQTGGIQVFNESTNYYVLCEGTIATGEDASSMFYNSENLKHIYGFETVDTSNATDMEDMFWRCLSLESVDLSKMNTAKVTNMKGMFQQCQKLSSMNLRNFNTSRVTTMEYMFYSCGGEVGIDYLDLSSFDTKNVTNMNYMFEYSGIKEVNLLSFNTEKVIKMNRMFYGSKFTKINICAFATPVLQEISEMFAQCLDLTTIYASRHWVKDKVTTEDTVSVFEGSTKLVGGSGTQYSASHINKEYARIDMLDDNIDAPGYFTFGDGIYDVNFYSYDSSTGEPYIYKTYNRVSGIVFPDGPYSNDMLWTTRGIYVAEDAPTGNYNQETMTYDYRPSKEVFPHFKPGESIRLEEYFSGQTVVNLFDVYTDEVNGKWLDCSWRNPGNYTKTCAGCSKSFTAYGGTVRLDFRVKLPTDEKEYYYLFWSNTYDWKKNNIEHDSFMTEADEVTRMYMYPGMYIEISTAHVTEIHECSKRTYDIKIMYNKDSSTSVRSWTNTTVENKFGGNSFQAYIVNDWVEEKLGDSDSGSGSGGCFATGTLITMADGSQLPIEEVSQWDMVRVYDHENGCYAETPVLFTEYDGDAEWLVANLEFSDGTTQKFIYDHALFDLDLNKYVYITAENCEEFIGHRFAKEEASGYSEVTLENAWAELEFTGCYSMTTTYHMNYFVNGMFSFPGGITGLFNFFEYDEDLKYDADLMERDIEKYGLFTYEDFADYMPEAVFEQIFPIKYLKVSIGKGLTTFEELEEIIERYIYGHNLLDDFEELPEEEPEEELEEELEEEEETEETTEDESEELEETEDLEENTEENGETETKDESTDEEKSTLNFEVENLTFDLADNEIVTNEDVVITFTASEGYELPETIVITIDGEEYIIYTCEEDSDKNPEGITFDIETGTLTISKDLLKDTEAITIAAEGIKKEDAESEDNKENTDADKKDESEDKDNTDNENESEGGETTDKETENGTNSPDDDKTETEGGTDDSGENNVTEPEDGTDVSGGENTETTTPETNPDNSTEGEAGGGNNSEDNGEDEGKTETPEPDTDVTTPTTPDKEDGTNTEQGGEKVETEGNGEGSTENGTEETIPDTEGNVDDETTIPTEPTTPAEPSEPAVSPETPKTETPSTSEPTTGGNDDDNGEIGSADSSSTEISINSGNDSPESDASSESTTSTTPSATPPAPTTSSPVASETSTPSASTQASSNSSNAPASSAPAPNADSNSNGASQASGTTAPSGSKETSYEE